MESFVTHDGVFHADDVFAAATLYIYSGVNEFVRTRDQKIIDLADIVFDVGGQYIPEEGRFDHHQGGIPPRPNGVPYSSFGLVWKEYGPDICRDVNVSDRVDRILVQKIDAVDNGINLWSGLEFVGVRPYTITDVVNSFRPSDSVPESMNRAFTDAVRFAADQIDRLVLHSEAVVSSENIARVTLTLSDKYEERFSVFDQYLPGWQKVAVQETENILYVVFPGTDGNWRVQAVPAELGSFEHRRSLPESWRGLNNHSLAKVTGVEDAVFCHKSGFIAGAKTRRGAISLALLAVE